MNNKKLTDKEFLAILREGGGLYARTVRLIKKQFKIDITRQSVRDRALKHPKELEDIREMNIDIAEEGIRSLMSSALPNVKLNACQFYLKTIGKNRGYIEKVENENNNTDSKAPDLSGMSIDELYELKHGKKRGE